MSSLLGILLGVLWLVVWDARRRRRQWPASPRRLPLELPKERP